MSTPTLNVTPGEWKVFPAAEDLGTGEPYFHMIGPSEEFPACSTWASPHEANAILIADAGTTYNRTHLLPSEMEQRIAELVKERDEAVAMLKVAACPNCDGRGWYAVASMPDGEPEQVQCQFCDERNTVLTRQTK